MVLGVPIFKHFRVFDDNSWIVNKGLQLRFVLGEISNCNIQNGHQKVSLLGALTNLYLFFFS